MMKRSGSPERQRIGRVSLYHHHGGWWVFYTTGGKAVRRLVGGSAALAECEASLVNAAPVAERQATWIWAAVSPT